MNRIKSVFVVFLLASVLFVALPGSVSSAATIQKEMFDPLDDVMEVTDSGDFKEAPTKDYLDIVFLNSYPKQTTVLGASIDWIAFNITIDGDVSTSSNVMYAVFVTTSDSYIVYYSGGTVKGVQISDGSILVPGAEIKGTHTVDTVTIQIKKDKLSGVSTSFEWKAAAIENLDTGKFADIAPDKIVRITHPYHESTKFGTIIMTGETTPSTYSIVGVEWSLDNTEVWVSPSTHANDWSTWSETIDTTTLSDGDHTLKVRANDTTDNLFTDSITFTVNQGYATSAPTLSAMRAHKVGDSTSYSIEADEAYVGAGLGGVGTSASMNVTRVETITVGSSEFECHFMEFKQSGDFSLGEFAVVQNVDRYSWATRDEKATVKETTFTNMSGEGLPISETESKTTATYDPPLNRYDLPLAVGEHWTSDNHISSKTHKVVDGEASDSTKEEDQTITVECLHKRSITYNGTSHDCYGIRVEIEGGDRYVVEYVTEGFSMPLKIETYDSNRDLVALSEMDGFMEGEGFWIDFESTPTVSSDNVKVGDTVTITATVVNNGEAAATDVTLQAVNGSVVIATGSVASIAAGGSADVAIEWSPSKAGVHYMTIQDENGMSESSRLKIVVGEKENGGPGNYLIYIIAVVVVVILIAVMAMRKKGGAAHHEHGSSSGGPEEEGLHDIKKVVHERKAEEAANGGGDAQDIQCPKCGATTSVVVKARPMRVKCSSCGAKIVIK